jgi:glycerol-1-phosphate dehydrogenase [NAD(P)+]
MKGFKVNAWAQAPLAIFADLPTLCRAPQRMIAAGFGDLLGKYTALADWQLDHLLWGEPYRPEIAARTGRALYAGVAEVDGLSKAEPEAVKRLMEGLVEAGLCMLENGNSRPASGSEHHLSHYWEMKLLRLGRPAVLHGVKVGIGTALVAGRYEQVRRLTRDEAARRLQASRLPGLQAEVASIEAAYGPVAPGIISEQRRFLDLTPEAYESLKAKILSGWDAIQAIAASVPSATEVKALLGRLAAPAQLAAIGMDPGDDDEALQYAHYLRDQFTVTKLGRVLNLW